MDKNTLIAYIATNLPDNTAQEITPSKVRSVLEQMVTADLNLEESATQTMLSGLISPSIQGSTVIVKQASDLSSIDSSKVYYIDGVVDMSGVEVTVPSGGLNIIGSTFNSSKLVCSDINYTLFKSSNSGSLLINDCDISVSGVGSKVFDIKGATGLEAFELSRVSFTDCLSLGEVSSFRQGLESGTNRFGGKPELTLSGTWLGGYFIDTSIVRNLIDDTYSLFKAGTSFVMNSRFRNNMNIDLPASASLLDFSSPNFTNPSTLQLENAIVTRNGAFNAQDSNITPNITAKDLVCSWSKNNGLSNTFVGGSVDIQATAVSTITAIDTFVDIEAGSWVASDLQHFDNPLDGQIRHLGNSPREFRVIASFLLESNANDELTLRVTRWNDLQNAFETVLDQKRQVNNLTGGRNVAIFAVNINLELDANDFVKLQVANNTSTADVTAEIDSYFIVEAR